MGRWFGSEKRAGDGGAPRWGVAIVVSALLHAAALLMLTHLVFRAARTGSPEIVFDVNLMRPAVGKQKGKDRQADVREREAAEKEQRLDASIPADRARAESGPSRSKSPPKSGKGKAPDKVIATTGGDGAVYAARAGAARKAAVKKWGGSQGSEHAVAEGLRWLALHQDPDGRWDADNFDKHCGDAPEPCTGVGDYNVDVAVTGLALLAFLGAGNTHEHGPHHETTKRAIDFLLQAQSSKGGFGRPYRMHMYDQGITTLALAEALGLTRAERLKGPVQKAVDFICAAQQTGGGWDYTSAPTGRNDTSVTGWQIMALKSARTAGVRVPNEVIRKALRHFRTCTNKNGTVRYTNMDKRTTPAMTAVGMVCRQFLGWPTGNDLLRAGARLLVASPPRWAQAEKGRSYAMYYWYYGTLAMFQMGGHYWEIWNTHMRDMLVEHQTRAGHARGSWEPLGVGSRKGGRVYSTAINVLNLEVYYRYLPLYEIRGADAVVALAEVVRDEEGRVQRDVVEVLLTLGPAAAPTLVEVLEDSPAQLRRRVVRFFGGVESEDARGGLRKAARDADEFVRLAAAEGLAARRDPTAFAVLRELMSHENDFVRSQTIRAISNWRAKEAVDLLIAGLSDRQTFIVERAAEALRRMCERDSGVRPGQAEEQRRRSVDAWQQWWRERRGSWGEQPAQD